MSEILNLWELVDKEMDPVCDAVKLALEDASLKARETARTCYLRIYSLNPKKAERIRMDLPKQLQVKLQSATTDDPGSREASMETGGQSSLNSTAELSASGGVSQSSAAAGVVAATPAKSTSTLPEKQTAGTPRVGSTLKKTFSGARLKSLETSSAKERSSDSADQSERSISVGKRPKTSESEPVRSLSASRKGSINAGTSKSVQGPMVSDSVSAVVAALEAAGKDQQIRSVDDSVLKAVASAGGNRRRSVVKNPFADISESFANSSNGGNVMHTINDLKKDFHRHGSAPLLKGISPAKPSPVKSTTEDDLHVGDHSKRDDQLRTNKPFSAGSGSGSGSSGGSASKASHPSPDRYSTPFPTDSLTDGLTPSTAQAQQWEAPGAATGRYQGHGHDIKGCTRSCHYSLCWTD